MAYEFHGDHIIAGEIVRGADRFLSRPVSGKALSVSEGSAAEVARAAAAAEAAFDSYRATTRAARAAFLETIAERIEARADAITSIATAETALPEGRIAGERGRTTGQLRLFAAHIRKGAYLDRRVDPALPERAPVPRPEIRMMQQPLGPVAVFGASNFPLAFSTAGGDTASALAAGCPVIVKGHPAHPGTAEIVAAAIAEAVADCGIDPGVFSLIQGAGHALGAALVTHPAVRAVGFTGSLGAGRALFDLCAGRDEPIPFFGELGSVNPVFVLPGALEARASAIGRDWAGSLTLGVGQFCTNPGIVVLPDGPGADRFRDAAHAALALAPGETMLTDAIAANFRTGRDRVAASAGAASVLATACAGREATPHIYEIAARRYLADPALGREVFGPLGLILRAANEAEMIEVARGLEGQLTCTLQMADEDSGIAARLARVLERKAGRILANGFPTGVEVCDAMVHGGPYPASTNFGATSVGTLAIRRFLRPVCYQNMPAALLPEDLQDFDG